MPDPLSIVSPLQPHNSTCGYCGPPGERSATQSSYHKAECLAMQLSCRVYQEMIDRGWRRSGTYCYKPDLKRSCCPAYTLKLDALQFKPSKSQRKLLNSVPTTNPGGTGLWYMENVEVRTIPWKVTVKGKPGAPTKGKGKAAHTFDLINEIHASEIGFLTDETPAHRFEVTLEPASFSDEKFALYDSYQQEIHHESHEKQPSGFKRFLVENPLATQPIDYPSGRPEHLPPKYGAYHQLYRLDGKLIGMGVIDILPNCVSSVYFMYDKEWEKFSLGKLSALREAALAKEIHDAGVEGMMYLYMGFYIHSCPKMRYKGDYAPSYLADPEDYSWHPLEACRPLLDKYHYACFAHPERSLDKPATSSGMDPTPDIPPDVLENVKHMVQIRRGNVVVAPIMTSEEWQREEARTTLLTTFDAVGEKLAQEMIFDLSFEL